MSKQFTLVKLLIAIIVILAAMLFPALSQAQEMPSPVAMDPKATFFNVDNITEEQAVELRKGVLSRIEMSTSAYEAEKPQMRNIAADPSFFLATCVAKRLEIADRLAQLTQDVLAENNADSTLLARRMTYELDAFTAYFKEMEQYYNEHHVKKMEPVIVSVKDFGAVGDNATDNVNAFRKALEYVKGLGGKAAVLKIPAGKYLFKKTERIGTVSVQNPFLNDGAPINFSDRYGFHVLVLNQENLTIEGEKGTSLIFSDLFCDSFMLVGCRNVKLKNLHMTFAENIFPEGIVKSVDARNKTIDLEMLPGEPDITPEYLRLNLEKSGKMRPWGLQGFDMSGRCRKEASHARINDSRKIGDRLFRVTISSPQSLKFESITPGYRIGITVRSAGRAIAPLFFCTFCTYEDVLIDRAPDASVIQIWCGPNNFIRYNIQPADGKQASINGDCLYSSYLPGIGPYVESCKLQYAGDDCMNITQTGRYILGYEKNILYIKGSPGQGVQFIRQMVSLVSNRTGKILLETFVKDIKPGKWRDQNALQVILEDGIPENVASYDTLKIPEYTDAQIGIGFIKEGFIQPDMLFLPLSGVGTVVRNNTLGPGRNAGMVIQSSSALIENNNIFNTGAGINLSSLMMWHEWAPPYNVVVRNNKISECEARAISTGYGFPPGIQQEAHPIRNILIENNEFSNNDRQLYLSDIQRVSVINNCFVGTAPVCLVKNVGTGNMIKGNRLNGKPLTMNDLTRFGDNGISRFKGTK